jgi:hypothetical protein
LSHQDARRAEKASLPATARQPQCVLEQPISRIPRETKPTLLSTRSSERPNPKVPGVEYRQSVELGSERRAVKLNVSLRSNIISAVIAGVIYLIIYLATGGGVAGALIGAVILAVIVFLIAFAFSRLIGPRQR